MSIKTKKVLFYNAIPMPHSISLYNGMLEKGYEVSFWFYKDLTSLYPWNSLNSENEYLVFGTENNNFRKLIKSLYDSDLVVISGWHTYIHILLVLIGRLLKVKVALWVDVPQKPKKSITYLFKIILMGLSDYILVTGNTGVNLIQKWFKLKSSKIKDFPYLSAEADEIYFSKVNQKRKLEIQRGDKIRVFISNRFEERKGYNVLFEAFNILGKEILSQLELEVAGSGSQYEYYLSEFKKIDCNITFLNWLSYENYLNRMERTDLFIHASIHEPFGIPPMDAMARGKLVIASDGVYSCLDRIISGKNGFIFGKDKPEELASIIKLITESKDSIYATGKEAIKTSKAYSIASNIDIIEQILVI